MCLWHGEDIETRNSKVRRVIGPVGATFNSVPLVSVKHTAFKLALREMEWIMNGNPHISTLHPSVRHWWKPFMDGNGNLANGYGEQFRNFHGKHGVVDQIEYIKDGLVNHPYSRRLVMTTWNTADMTHVTTPITNCHGSLVQLFVDKQDKVHMIMNQRSCDVMLGMQHNWLQYWALLMYLANSCGRKVGTLRWLGGDVHLYEDHVPFAQQMSALRDLPHNDTKMEYNPTSPDFKADDFTLVDRPPSYCKPKLKMHV